MPTPTDPKNPSLATTVIAEFTEVVGQLAQAEAQRAEAAQLAAQLANADEARTDLADQVADQAEDLGSAQARALGAEQDLRRVTRERDDLAPWKVQLQQLAAEAAQILGIGAAMPTDPKAVAELARVALRELAGIEQPVGCIWCGEQVSPDRRDLRTAARVREHYATCKKIPAREVERAARRDRGAIEHAFKLIDQHREAEGKGKGSGPIDAQVAELLQRIRQLESSAETHDWQPGRIAELEQTAHELELRRADLANRLLQAEEQLDVLSDAAAAAAGQVVLLNQRRAAWRNRAEHAEGEVRRSMESLRIADRTNRQRKAQAELWAKDAEQLRAQLAIVTACNEAMREPMNRLRAAVKMPAEGEGAVIDSAIAQLAAWREGKIRLDDPPKPEQPARLFKAGDLVEVKSTEVFHAGLTARVTAAFFEGSMPMVQVEDLADPKRSFLFAESQLIEYMPF